MIEAKLQPLGRELELLVRADLSAATRSKLIAATARADIADIDRTNDAAAGTDVKYRTFVDGREGGSLESVNPDHGTIAAVWDLGLDVVQSVLQLLREHSPVGSGRDPHPGLYRDSHILFADGQAVTSASAAPAAQEYAIISGVPYARKIETRTADGVYESVAALARQRFGNIAKISFAFRSLSEGGGTALDLWASASGKRHAGAKGKTRQPAIIIRMN